MRLTNGTSVLASILVVVAGVLVQWALPEASPPFRVSEDTGTAGFSAVPDVFAISTMATIVPTAPFTLLRVRPRHLDPGFRLLDARIMFWGREGSTTGSGYRRANGLPAIECGQRPITGHGTTYPAEGLRLDPTDGPASVIFYLAASEPGLHTARGYHIEFRTDDGRKGSVSGDGRITELTIYPPGAPPPPGTYFRTDCPHRRWTSRSAGFPK